MATAFKLPAAARFHHTHDPLPQQSSANDTMEDRPTTPVAESHTSSRSVRSFLSTLMRALVHWRKKPRETVQPSDAAISTSHSGSRLEHSIATMRTSSIRSLSRPFRKHSRVDMLDETWEDWLERYQDGSRNLSTLSRPVSFSGFGHMPAPHHKNEVARLRSLAHVSDRIHWRNQRGWLDQRLRDLLVRYRLKAATASLLEKTCQFIFHDVGLRRKMTMIGRDLSLDAHTILSAEYFALLDAGSDWRTRLNPLVHGPPFIKFYLGVPIFIRNQPVGCLAVFDPYLKSQVPQELIEELQALANELSRQIEGVVGEPPDPGYKPRIQWADDDDSGNVPTPCSGSSESTAETAGTVRSVGTTTSDKRGYSVAAGGATNIDIILSDIRMCPLTGPRSSRMVLQPYEVFESLLRCSTIPQAIKKACRIVWQNLGMSLVYVVEVRSKRAIELPKARISTSSTETGLEEVPEVRDEGAGNPMIGHSHFVASYGPGLNFEVESEVKQLAEMHSTAILSKYGFKFTASDEASSKLRSGILIPFRRKPEEAIVWAGDEAAEGEDAVKRHAHSGGFVMGAFVLQAREYSPGDVKFMKKVVKALENILICRDEQSVLE